MKSTVYLYNLKPEDLMSLNYEDAIRLKITKANEVLKELLEVNYQDRDDAKIRDVFNAIKFNKSLLMELEVKDEKEFEILLTLNS